MITNCQVCGKEFKTYPSRGKGDRGKFCSRECYAKELSRRMTGTGHPMYGKNHTEASKQIMREKQLQREVKGVNHPTWKGGRHLARGYVMIALDTLSLEEQSRFGSMATRSSKRYIPEHRLVMARHLGRVLEPTEVIHHINGNKSDNRLENLDMYGAKTHKMEHQALMRELQELRAENERLRLLLATYQSNG